MSSPTIPSAEEQWAVIQKLQKQVQALQQPAPTRRQVVKSAGLLGALGVAGSGGYVAGNSLIGSAKAVDATDLNVSQIGSTTNRITYYSDLIDTTQLRITQGRGILGLPNHHINYGKNLTNEEIARFSLSTADKLEVWRLEASLKGGGTNSNVTIDVYDSSDGRVLASVTGGGKKEGGSDPLGVSSAGATILVRVSTGSASIDLCATGQTAVVKK